MPKIKVAVVGCGNCCSSLVQGVHYYTENSTENSGIRFEDIGGYAPKDIEFVAAFDIDVRKIGKPLNQALLEKPNNTPIFYPLGDLNLVKVQKAPILDGVCDTTTDIDRYGQDSVFIPYEDEEPEYSDIIDSLEKSRPDIIINYLPVGSQRATEFWAEVCLHLKIAFLNCIPVFIASDEVWADRFYKAGVPLIGDDMRSQLGASVLSQVLQRLFHSRGVEVLGHLQQNYAYNTDFLNLSDPTRTISKKISKESVIKSQSEICGKESGYVFAGPTHYFQYDGYADKKTATFHIEGKGFMGAPISLEANLKVIDSPNSAGVVIDAIRFLKVAKELGLCGALRGPSSFSQKHPPKQMTLEDAERECELLSQRVLSQELIENNIRN